MEAFRMNYFRRKINIRLRRRQPYYVLKRRRIKFRRLAFSRKRLRRPRDNRAIFGFYCKQVSPFIIPVVRPKINFLYFMKNKFVKFSSTHKFIYFKFKLKKYLTREIRQEIKFLVGRRGRVSKNKLAGYSNYFNLRLGDYFEETRSLSRGYFTSFVEFFMSNYSRRFLPFIFNLNFYGNYLQKLKNLPFISDQIRPRQLKKKNLLFTPLINKFRRLRFLEGKKKSLLYGYKFHFSGRFTRKQKAASL